MHRHRSPFLTGEIREFIRRRDYVAKQFKKNSGSSTLKQDLTMAQRGVKSRIRRVVETPAIFGQPGTEYLISPPKFVIVVFIIVNSVSAVHIIWRNVDAKMHKNAHIFVLQFKIFSGSYASDPPCWRGATAPFHKPHPPRHSGAAPLSRLARGLNRPRNVC